MIAATRSKILNVDDREVGRYIRTQILREAGFDVVEASCGTEALAKTHEEQPDLVLLDVNMPDIDGLEVCRRIKASPAHAAVVVLQISSTATGTDIQTRALEGGADGYVTEPIEPALLIAQIRSLLRLRHVEERLFDSELRFRTVFAEAPVGLMLVDPDLTIQQANASVSQMLAWPEAFLFGRYLSDLLHAEDAPSEAPLIRHVLEGQSDRYHTETRFVRRSGEPVICDMTVSLVRDRKNAPRYATVLLQDISERKRAEAALLRSNEDLNQFAYAASHDLQEPMRAIANYTQLLARRYQAQLDPGADEIIGYVVQGTLRLQALLKDLMEFSRVHAASGDRNSRSNTAEVVDLALNNLRVALDESGATVVTGSLPEVAADSGPLVQLFQNLIGNSIKYRRPDVPARIEIIAEERGFEWVFAVRDNGLGFNPESAERIFGVFQRLHGRDVPGTGIGLALCKKIVERFGGRIWAESTPGDGSTFWFTLPAVPEDASAAAP